MLAVPQHRGLSADSADVVSGRRKGGSAVIRPAKNAPWLPLAALRRRPLPALPAGLAGYLVALVGLATGLAAVGLSTTPVRVVHLVTWAALVGAGVVCMELTRAAGQPAGLSRDLLSAWKIPVALLLPPVYALVTATLFVTLQQRRVRPGLMHRRVLSAAALGLADGAASLLFHWLLPPQTSPASWFVHRPLAALGAGVLCGLVGNALSAVLLATAARLSSPEISWRSVLSDQPAQDAGPQCRQWTMDEPAGRRGLGRQQPVEQQRRRPIGQAKCRGAEHPTVLQGDEQGRRHQRVDRGQ